MYRSLANKIIAVGMLVLIAIGMTSYASYDGFIRPVLLQLRYGYSQNLTDEDATVYDRLMSVVTRIEEEADEISYRYMAVEVSTALGMIQGQREFTDDICTVAYLDNGMLSIITNSWVDTALCAQNLIELDSYLEGLGTELLYVQAPYKLSVYDDQLPLYSTDNNNEIADALLAGIEGAVDYIDLRSEMYEAGLNQYDYFFTTDHHWLPEGALWAAGTVSQWINDNYDYQIDTDIYDLTQYDITVYEEWFLGSEGKRVGTWVAGVDDISIIIPSFETDFTFQVPSWGILREGSFADTMFEYSHIATKDYYEKNSYAVYTGADYDLNLITNHLNPDGKKVLVVRDSFSCAFTPFMVLACSQLDVIDLRYYTQSSLKEYVAEEGYDAVIVLYNPSMISADAFNFG